jgi:hypothetical protein
MLQALDMGIKAQLALAKPVKNTPVVEQPAPKAGLVFKGRIVTTTRINGMKLIHEDTGVEVEIGETVKDFRGEPAEVTGWATPLTSASTGRVHVKENGHDSEYYPGVFGLKIVKV